MLITCLVLLISGLSITSQLWNFSNAKAASFIEMCLGMTSSSKFRSLRDFDDMTRAAYLERGCPMAFETEGTVQEARGLASSKKTSLDDVIACSHVQNFGGEENQI
ncbi:hypothetical protein Bca101_050698 [Brassica carinata]